MIFDRDTAIRAALAFAVGSICLFWVIAALARDDGRYANAPPEIKKWFKSQKNSTGQWCCDESDGHAYFGDYTLNQDGSVTVEGETIPKEKVLTGTNPTGHAVWWRLGVTTYCFSPGTLG